MSGKSNGVLKDVLLKDPVHPYESGSQGKAHLLNQTHDLRDEIRVCRHEQRSADRWYMGFLGALGFGAVTLHSSGNLVSASNGPEIRIAATMVVFFTAILWMLDKNTLFDDNSDRYKALNLLEDELPANVSRALWALKKLRGIGGMFKTSNTKLLSREEQSKLAVRANRIRVVVTKPVLVCGLALILALFIF